MEFDLGDVTATFGLQIKGRKHPQFRWKIGAAIESEEDDRARQPSYVLPYKRSVNVYMDLMSDKKVSLSIEFTDEMGNPVSTPGDSSVAYTCDNGEVVNLTDNGDGTAVAAAVGPTGTANVHAEVSLNGQTMTGDLQINVVTGLAERVNIVAGEPEEVTPDDQTG